MELTIDKVDQERKQKHSKWYPQCNGPLMEILKRHTSTKNAITAEDMIVPVSAAAALDVQLTEDNIRYLIKDLRQLQDDYNIHGIPGVGYYVTRKHTSTTLEKLESVRARVKRGYTATKSAREEIIATGMTQDDLELLFQDDEAFCDWLRDNDIANIEYVPKEE